MTAPARVCLAPPIHLGTILVTSALLVSALPDAVHGRQQVTEIPADVSCAECRVELRRVITLDAGSADPGVIGYIPTVARSSSTGTWYAAATDGARQIGVFDARGRLLRLLGRAGEGPGEYARISRLEIGPGDTLYVYDRSLGRRTIYGPEHDLITIDPLPGGFFRDVVTLASGRYVASMIFQTTERVGYPLHLVSSNGMIEKSFGVDVPVYPPRDPDGLDRTIAVDRAGRVWSAHVAQYRLEVFDPQGRKVAEYTRDPPWWRFESRRERPVVWGIAFDQNAPHILWIRISVPAPVGDRPVRPGAAGERGARPSQDRSDASHDTILEALDVRSGQIIASRRFEQSFVFNQQGLVSYVRLDDLDAVLDVYQPVLITTSGRLP